AFSVIEERRTPNCRVESGSAGSGIVIISERAGPHRGVSKGFNVLAERLPANCRVVVGSGVARGVIIRERLGTHGGVINGINVGRKRDIAKSRVVDSVDVAEKRESAKSVVAAGYIGSTRVIIVERKAADSIVVAGD